MFTFPLDPKDLFAERRGQFVAWGIPARVVARVEARVTDTWHEGPGGWPHEWWQEAARAEARGQWMLAARLFGAARFPVIATPLRREALGRQVASFGRASARFPFRFERITLPGGDAPPITVHRYGPPRAHDAPVVLLSGGVDTGKFELHRMALALSLLGGFTVIALDMPGTGESDMPLTVDADRIYVSVLRHLAQGRKTAIVGVSFGGHWAARLALQHDLDAAIDLGGPVIGKADVGLTFLRHLPHGMAGIIANALRFPALPTPEEVAPRLTAFSLVSQGLFARGDSAPLLVVNGDQDPYVPVEEVTAFAAVPGAEVWLLEGLGHCAAEALPRVVPGMTAWLRHTLHGPTVANRAALRVGRAMLPRRVALRSA